MGQKTGSKPHFVRKLITALSATIFLGSTSGSGLINPANANGVGRVYAMTNAISGNKVQVFRRTPSGSLVLTQEITTGGQGTGPGFTAPSDPLGSQNSLLLSNRWLFAVNAASNDISVFRVAGDRVSFVEKVSSGGIYPVSLTVRNNLLYVLNALGNTEGQGSIAGFRIESNGHLTPLANSVRLVNTLSDATFLETRPAGTPANAPPQPNVFESPVQVSFSPKGDQLVITDKGIVSNRGLIHVFALDSQGIPSPTPTTTVATDIAPFGFVFDAQGRLVVTNAIIGGITVYTLNSNGTVTPVSNVSNQLPPISATCWIIGTKDQRYFYASNTLSNNVNAFEASPQGVFSLLNGPGLPASTGAFSNPTDVTISGRFLYVVSGGLGAINAYRINSDGSLSFQETIHVSGPNPIPQGSASGAQGLAASD